MIIELKGYSSSSDVVNLWTETNFFHLKYVPDFFNTYEKWREILQTINTPEKYKLYLLLKVDATEVCHREKSEIGDIVKILRVLTRDLLLKYKNFRFVHIFNLYLDTLKILDLY